RQLRNRLSRQRRVGVALPVVAVVEWHVILVALAHLGRRRAFARHGHTGQIARTAYVERRILRDAAVELARRPIRVVLQGGGTPLLGRQEPGGAWWWQVEVQVECQVVTLVVLFGVPLGHAYRLGGGGALRQQHNQLLEARLVGDGDLTDAHQIRQYDRQRRLQPVEQGPHLVGGSRALLED